MRDFRNKMREKMALLRMDEGFASRYVNEGFSGGEKKRLEMLQMAVLEPEMAILDETDSGLDIDALRIVAEGVNAMLNPNLGVLLITHYQRLLNYITPDFVHVLAQGRIVKSGGKDLALRLEDEGYGPILREAGLSPDVPDEALLRARRVADAGELEAGGGRPLGGRDRWPSTIRSDGHAGRRARPVRSGTSSAATSRSSTRRSTATRSSTSTRRRRSQKPQVVIDAMDTYYREYNANVHRGIYTIGEQATAAYEKARAQVARFINAPDSHEIVFTRNATEAINLVAYSWGRRNIGRGDAIVLTEMEHHANLVPWQLLVQEKDGDLEFIPITDDGILRLDVFEVLLRLKPKLVAFTHVSNTLGTINPVREMTEMAHAAGALVLSTAPRPCRTCRSTSRSSAADFYAFSGHKMLAPMGSGALWARRELLEAMPPFLSGGEMIREVHLRRSRLQRDPLEVRGGHAGRRRRDRAGRGGRLPGGRSAWTPSASTSASSSTYALEVAPARGPRDRALRPDGSGPCAAASSRSTCRASTRTTSPRCSTAPASPSGPATTARCRSTSGWTSRPRPGRSFNVYTTREDIDALGSRPRRGAAGLRRLTCRGRGGGRRRGQADLWPEDVSGLGRDDVRVRFGEGRSIHSNQLIVQVINESHRGIPRWTALGASIGAPSRSEETDLHVHAFKGGVKHGPMVRARRDRRYGP